MSQVRLIPCEKKASREQCEKYEALSKYLPIGVEELSPIRGGDFAHFAESRRITAN